MAEYTAFPKARLVAAPSPTPELLPASPPRSDTVTIERAIADRYYAAIGTAGVAVYNRLVAYANQELIAFPSQATLAADLGINRETVRFALRALIAAGLVTRTKRVARHHYLRTVYLLSSPPHAPVPRGGGLPSGSPLPADWMLTDALFDWTLAEGFSLAVTEHEAHKFFQFYRARQRITLDDWNAEFKLWMLHVRDRLQPPR